MTTNLPLVRLHQSRGLRAAIYVYMPQRAARRGRAFRSTARDDGTYRWYLPMVLTDGTYQSYGMYLTMVFAGTTMPIKGTRLSLCKYGRLDQKTRKIIQPTTRAHAKHMQKNVDASKCPQKQVHAK